MNTIYKINHKISKGLVEKYNDNLIIETSESWYSNRAKQIYDEFKKWTSERKSNAR